jgi:hypothetical protein
VCYLHAFPSYEAVKVSPWSFQPGVATCTGDCRVGGDSPSSWAPPLGEAVTAGLTLAPRSGVVDGLNVAAPVGRGLGDAPPGVGRGETVAAGDALAVCADIGTIAATRTTSMAPSKSNVFISDWGSAQSNESPTNKNRHTSLPRM